MWDYITAVILVDVWLDYNTKTNVGLYFNTKIGVGLDCNNEIDVGLDFNQITNGASKDNALEVNFEDSEDDIGVSKDITVDHEETLEKEKRDE